MARFNLTPQHKLKLDKLYQSRNITLDHSIVNCFSADEALYLLTSKGISAISISSLNSSLLSSKEFILNLIDLNLGLVAIAKAPIEIQDDKSLILAAILKSDGAGAYIFASKRLKADIEVAAIALQQGLNIPHIEKTLRSSILKTADRLGCSEKEAALELLNIKKTSENKAKILDSMHHNEISTPNKVKI